MNNFVKTFIHPEDAAALEILKKVPGVDILTKKVLDLGMEQMLYGVNMASKIRLSERQKPDLYNKLVQICKQLQIETPEFYLEMNPIPNAYTFGETRICIVVTSGLLEYLKEDEIEAVLAHECGHILCHHVLYSTMARIITEGGELLNLLGPFYLPLQYALLYWSRKSELSADRVSLLISGKDTTLRTQLRLAGGPECVTSDIDIEEWAKQADSYDEIRNASKWDKILQILAVSTLDHPFAAVRVNELLKWAKTQDYQDALVMLLQKNIRQTVTKCPRCQAEVEPESLFCPYCNCKLSNS